MVTSVVCVERGDSSKAYVCLRRHLHDTVDTVLCGFTECAEVSSLLVLSKYEPV
jgi:hypothetical protein